MRNLITYLLSKLIPLFFSPLGIILILLFAFIINKKTKFIYSALSILLIFSNGVFSNLLWKFIEYPWKRLDYSSVNSADAIVVLSGGREIPPGNTKIIEWHDPDRFFAGIGLYRAEKSSRLIFTGAINPFNLDLPPEGDNYIKEAISIGIPRKDLFSTQPVLNTFQEAKEIKKLLYKEKVVKQRKIILVTSAFHMKRAKKVFEREGINVIPYPVDFNGGINLSATLRNPIKWMPTSNNLNKSSQVIREIIGRLIYRAW